MSEAMNRYKYEVSKREYLALRSNMTGGGKDYGTLYDKSNKKATIIINNFTVHIEPRFSKNFKQEYIMITIDQGDAPKISEYLESRYSEIQKEVGESLTEEIYRKVVDTFMKNFKEMHITIWKNPFLEEDGTYHVVSGTNFNDDAKRIVGVYKSWFKLNRDIVIKKDDYFPPRENPHSDIDYKTYRLLIFLMYMAMVAKYVEIFHEIIKQIE